MQAMSWEYGDLVAASGMSKSVVSQWLGRGSKPIHSIGHMAAAERLEAATGFAALWLAKGQGPKRIEFGSQVEARAWQELGRASMQARPVRENEEMPSWLAYAPGNGQRYRADLVGTTTDGETFYVDVRPRHPEPPPWLQLLAETRPRDFMLLVSDGYGDSFAQQVQRWLERRKEVADSLPITRGQAQPLSLDAFTVPPELPWTTVQTTSDLPQSFILAAPDDALAPDVPRGMRLLMERHDGGPLEPGDGVLVETADGRRALRMYAEGPAGGWMAAAKHPAYASFDSQRDGLRVLAVLTGKLGRKI